MAELSTKVGEPQEKLPSRLPTLTGSRVIPALFVFLFHANGEAFFASQDFTAKYTSVVYQGGWAALTFFFVLSGFVLTWGVRPADGATGFWRRRICKIYPNHLFTGVAGVLLVLLLTANTSVFGGQEPTGGTIIRHLLLIQSWSPDWMVRTAINPPAWSLSCEVLFYLLFPLFYAGIRRIRPERLWAWFAGVASLACVVVPVVAATVIPHKDPIPGMGFSLEQFWFMVQFPPTRGIEFVLGMLLARIVITRRRLPISIGGAVALLVGAYAAAPLFPVVVSNNAILLIPMCLLIARMAVHDWEGRTTWFSGKLMVRLGEITFAFYLWHQIVLMYGDYLLGNKSYSTPVGILVVLLLFGVSLALGTLLYTYWEMPIMRKFGTPRRWRKQQALEPVVTVPPAGKDGPTELKRAS
ncbi:acyltransferase family protein [Actinophytocola oryzae]|uniref:Peptidoglycan/LPS O-acetylase OafA/YrhL n=1 Tax=Actinophytocola oryzae TaxID=502181 RepID=A0A4R7V0X4_9PSEU|nr:acyltransferase [Actinophytocola oryzae]TDV41056.1 peptidoglycan/LPS O-acetylase OafA/YrhL [Actinophytocola oryzae]